MSDNTIYTEANRLAWNTAMPYHRKAKDNQWDTAFADPDFIIQKEPEISKLRELGIQDRDVVHLCCNNGLELMSLKRLGAKRSVGFDISDEAIKDAISRAARFGIAAEFYQSDVYAIPQDFHACFDVVYITIGALVWLPDLDGFFQMAASLLRPGGHVFIYEQHPFAQVLPWDVSGTCEKPSIQYDYFYDEPQVYNDGLDYYGNESYAAPDTYEFIHTLSEVVMGIVQAGLVIRGFWEYEEDISNGLGWVQKCGLRLPLSYILLAGKQ